MTYRVVFYCPDRHIEYDGSTPYEVGVGGGVTARVRMARALCRAGHDVKVVANCPQRGIFDGVEYIPLQDCYSIEADVLIVNTSGGAMDLRPIADISIDTQITILWAHGSQKPLGLEDVGFDYLYSPSNFLATLIHSQWCVSLGKIFVAYNPFDEDLFLAAEKNQIERNQYRIVYFSHPSKGLAASMEVLSRLRTADPRFHLVVFGGYQLWGQAEVQLLDVKGLTYYGLIGQMQLAKELIRCSFSLCLQTREEPFGMVLTESMRAGCIVFASAIGSFNEIIRQGNNGYLLNGEPLSKKVQDEVVSLICELIAYKERQESIRSKAQAVPWNSDRMARVWTGHWNRVLNPSEGNVYGKSDKHVMCEQCTGKCIQLDDGLHCLECGYYLAMVENRD